MEKVLKRVTHHKKQNTNTSSKHKDKTNGLRASSINKRYSVDDNFYTYASKNELYQNCCSSSNTNFYTMSNRGEFKRNTLHRSRADTPASEFDSYKQLTKEDVTFKKLLKMFNSGENSRGAKEWFTSNASNVMELAPKILTKRFCSKKGDNELYRSNSFKFERFERTDSDTLTISKKSPVSRQISLCDDYSLPVDFVNKRPLSLDSGSFWSAPSPNGDQVEVLNLYCDPKDSKSQALDLSETANEKVETVDDKAKLYSVIQKSYHQPIADSSDDAEYEDDEAELYENLKHRKVKSGLYGRSAAKCNSTYTEVRKSPYYYGDLLKRSQSENPAGGRRYDAGFYRKSQSLDAEATCGQREPIYSNDVKYLDQNLYPFHIEEEEEVEKGDEDIDVRGVDDNNDDDDDDDDDDDMATRQRHMYETAFDSKICRGGGEMLELDAVTNHVMERCSPQLPYNPTFGSGDGGSMPKDRPSSHKLCFANSTMGSNRNKLESSMDSLAQQFADFDLTERSTLLHGYSSASTSTIPLPVSVSSHLNDSVETFSESSLTSSRLPAPKFFRHEMLHLKRMRDVKSGDHMNTSNENISNNNNNEDDEEDDDDDDDKVARHEGLKNIHVKRPQLHNHPRQHHSHRSKRASSCSSECRPKSCHIPSKIMEIKGRPKVPGSSRRFSSTESMTTSSSGGSLESIRSSTSEGNRSTTSTDSRRSSSISSHSSDSAMGSGGYHFSLNFPPSNRYLNQNKMHVLSPISDKSFQEACSECSEVNRNGGSCSPPLRESPRQSRTNSPEGGSSPTTAATHSKGKKQRPTPSKNAAVGLTMPLAATCTTDAEAHQCSDSGISMESRSDTSKVAPNGDLGDLPFDMPKLRRRRLQQMQLTQGSTQDTSSSATSVDLKDLPFDMPKLRRKLRSTSAQDSFEIPVISNLAPQALSSTEPQQQQSQQIDNEMNKASNVLDQGRNRKSLGLSLNLNDVVPAGVNIDTDLPLERQGWYHGAITRMEAENELRSREEGSYLVRNSESAKQDYSLSLKSAKGFMHMRIQKSADSDKFILGQFSSPFDSIPQMIKHYSSNQLPIRGAEHMCLLQPVIVQLL